MIIDPFSTIPIPQQKSPSIDSLETQAWYTIISSYLRLETNSWRIIIAKWNNCNWEAQVSASLPWILSCQRKRRSKASMWRRVRQGSRKTTTKATYHRTVILQTGSRLTAGITMERRKLACRLARLICNQRIIGTCWRNRRRVWRGKQGRCWTASIAGIKVFKT